MPYKTQSTVTLIADLLFMLAGAVLCLYGLHAMYPPAAFVVGGAFLYYIGSR
jgi:hypothetical protein